MTDALVEHVHDAVSGYCIHTGDAVDGKCADCAKITRAAILAVLEFYSEPGNVTDKMADECACTPESLDDARDMVADAFRAALRAAGDEVSRG